MEAASLYTPSAWGAKFHQLDAHEALGAGSAGPGKSLVLLYEPLAQIFVEHQRCIDKKHPFYHPWGASTGAALHLRRTTPMLETSILRSHKTFKVIDPRAAFDINKNTWTFSSGYRYKFGHCNERNDWDRYQSDEYSIILFDELCQFLEEQYHQITSRLRSSDPVLATMLKIRSMSNPVLKRVAGENFTVDDPQWVRRYFVDPAPEGNTILKRKLVRHDGTVEWRTRIYLPAKLRDNPDPAFVRQYELELLAKPAHIRMALLEGDWYVTADSYFADVWNPNLHICSPFRIPEDWPMFRSMDWGYQTQGCIHWYAQDSDGTTFVFKELTFKKKTADVVAEMVKDIEVELGLWGKNGKSRITGPADTQLWEQRGETGKSKAHEFMERGIPWTKADKKSRIRNAERVSALLDSHKHGTIRPGLVIFKGCKNLIRTLPAVQTSPTNPEEPADGGEDHWYDSLCYGSAYLSRGRSFIGSKRDDDDEFESELKERENRGRYGYGSSVA